jgi:hypothetical protein
MLNSQQANVQEQIAELQHALQTKLGVLHGFDQLREQCPGYNWDLSSGEYERVARQSAQTKQQLAETKRKVVVSPTSRAAVPRIIQALRSW